MVTFAIFAQSTLKKYNKLKYIFLFGLFINYGNLINQIKNYFKIIIFLFI